MKKPGLLVLISSPSGGGKNTVIEELLKRFDNAARFVTTTTREARPGEEHGIDYFFMSKAAFMADIEAGNFIEYNEYAGNFYGQEKQKMNDFLSQHDIVFSQADVNGKHAIDRLGITHASYFLLPESLDILRQRLEERGDVSEQKMQERLRIAEEEIKQADAYDAAIVNAQGKLSDTVDQLETLIRAQLALDKHTVV